VKCRDDADWVKCCVMMKVDGTSREVLSEEDLVGLCQAGYEGFGPVLR